MSKLISKSSLAEDLGNKQRLAELIMTGLGQDATDRQKEAFERFSEQASRTEQNLNYADRFNRLFAQLGWIAHESMPIPLLVETVTLAEEGSWDKAEAILVERHGASAVQNRFSQLRKARRFKHRMALLELALEDYKAQRFHACIPVVLMMIDGISVEVSKNRKGIFNQGSEVYHPDSIVGHGLPLLKHLLTRQCNQTNSARGKVPFRHGILHGRLLGYANEFVAAKAWALLFYVHDWVQIIEPRVAKNRK